MAVIDSLSAGYRLLSHHLYLILLPVVLDLFLWLAPKITLASLMEGVVALYKQLAAVENLPSEMISMVNQAATLLADIGQSFNLLNLTVSNSLLRVPSLMIALDATLAAAPIDITNWPSVIVLALVFGAIGVLLGVVYMNLLARALPLGNTPKAVGWSEFAGLIFHHWLRLLLFLGLVAFVLMAGMLPIAIGVSVASLLSPMLGSLFTVLVSGFMLAIFLYLFFVAPGIIVDNLSVYKAVSQSILLVRNNFRPTVGFWFLTNVIVAGFYFLVSPIADYGPLGVLVAIGANAFIGSGLAMALLVFYRTRILSTTTAGGRMPA